MNRDDQVVQDRQRFLLHEHPWLAMLASMVMIVVAILISGIVVFGLAGLPDDQPLGQFLQGTAHYLLASLVLIPLLLRLPRGKTAYRAFLADIGLTRVDPFLRLVLLALSCYLILALCQGAASIVFRLFEGAPVTWGFLRDVFDISADLPPQSVNLLITIPSMLEEITFRGIVLTTFLNKVSQRKAILFSSLGFGAMHALNLIMGRDPVWVLGQVIWAFCIGLFYGYVFVRTQSLIPSMIVHYLGNAFIGSLTGYLQARAAVEVQALYGVIFSLGLAPSALMILWARFYINNWIPAARKVQKGGD